jgi:hypothetical protein
MQTEAAAADPRDTLREWIAERGCSIAWVAEQIGWSREMLSYVVNKRCPLSPKLARDLRKYLAVPVTGQARRRARTARPAGKGISGSDLRREPAEVVA